MTFVRCATTFLAATFVASLLAGCSADEAAAPQSHEPQKPVVLPTDAESPGPCEPVRAAVAPIGCFGSWRCESPNLRNLVCAANDGGLSCACSEGDASVRFRTDAGCKGESDMRALAVERCGWAVP